MGKSTASPKKERKKVAAAAALAIRGDEAQLLPLEFTASAVTGWLLFSRATREQQFRYFARRRVFPNFACPCFARVAPVLPASSSPRLRVFRAEY